MHKETKLKIFNGGLIYRCKSTLKLHHWRTISILSYTWNPDLWPTKACRGWGCSGAGQLPGGNQAWRESGPGTGTVVWLLAFPVSAKPRPARPQPPLRRQRVNWLTPSLWFLCLITITPSFLVATSPSQTNSASPTTGHESDAIVGRPVELLSEIS